MKFVTGLIVSAAVSLVLMVAFVVLVGQVCGSSGLSASGLAVPIQFQPDAMFQSDIMRLRALPAVLMQGGFEPAQLMALQPVAASSSWVTNFLCTIKATDVAMTGFALFLVLTLTFQGLIQGAWMRRLLLSSEHSALVVNEALISAQRAYVFLREFRLNLIKNPLNEEIQICTIQPIWENTGATPTRGGRSQVNWKFFERSVPAEFDFPDFDEVGNRILSYDDYKPLIVGPKATALAPLIDIEPGVLRQVRDLQGRLLIWGWVEYDEVFTDAGRHRTEFCYQVAVTGSPMSWVGFTQYRAFNGVDDDCMKEPTLLARED
ncbi:MAG: hypothetical protein KJZ73_06410 [Pseudorhodoplanes sp.]|nr:hypothetical protein [Pseudorhodoplanes sp.]MBW7950315.1 hypothetical protein [Pseudorhodoplanes sp.]MCL4710864.1 hypothetical protein [Pseudorhodoplanes sp.]